MNKYKIFFPIILLIVAMIQISFADLFNIGGGRKIYMQCAGAGSPTVILIAGARDRGDSAWDTTASGKPGLAVFSAVAKFTRVCAYDRPGTILPKPEENIFEKSRSDVVPQPVTAKDGVADLHALLIAAKVPGPYVIVAHSAGGLIARLYVATYPKNVAGIVLVDTTFEKLQSLWTPKQWQVFEYSTKNVPKDLAGYKGLETIDFNTSFKQIRVAHGIYSLKIPAIVISADQPPNCKALIKEGLWPKTVTKKDCKQIWAAVLKSQEILVKSFQPQAKHITQTNSGHYVQKDNPKIVIAAIQEMVEEVRTPKKLGVD